MEVFSSLVFSIMSQILVFDWLPTFVVESVSDNNIVFGVDMSIEGLRSQVFSNYIFFFLVLSLLVFGFIIYLYMPKGDDKKLKTGEKVMFGAIIIGLFLAVIMGYVQLIEGYLI